MAKQNRRAASDAVGGTEQVAVLDPDLTPSEVEAFEEIARIREELGDEEGKVILRRRNDKGQLSHCGIMSAVDFSIERVMQDWGGGRYEVSFFKGKDKLGSTVFTIDESIPRRIPRALLEVREEEPAGGHASLPAVSSGNPELVALREVLSRQADLLNQLVVQIATGGNRNGDHFSIKDAMDLALKMTETIVSRTPAPEKPAINDLKDVLMAGIEIGKSAEGGDNSYWPVLQQFAGPVARVLEGALDRDKRGRLPPGARPPDVPQVPPPQPPVEAPVDPNMPAWLSHLKPHLPVLMNWAKMGKDPSLYAEVLLDNIPEAGIFEIRAASQDPQFVDKTLAVLPMFRPYSAWATQMLTNIKELLNSPPEEVEAEEESDTGGGGGAG